MLVRGIRSSREKFILFNLLNNGTRRKAKATGIAIMARLYSLAYEYIIQYKKGTKKSRLKENWMFLSFYSIPEIKLYLFLDQEISL